MKQIPLTPVIRQKLQKAVGDGVDISKHAVFEATGLNTRPVRKDHPLYKGARHTSKFLQQMASAANSESVPLNLVHNDTTLPYGRVFDAQVIPDPDDATEAELRTLFWIDPSEPGVAELINNGTVDQVSISALPAEACCSQCGWNFMGSDSNIDKVFSGTCDNGHVIGADGTHVIMDNLGQWFEMSLVGRGGAQGAKILPAHKSLLGGHSALSLSALSKDERDKLPDEHFAVPGKRQLPINDETHTRLAWDMVDKTQGLTAAERSEAKVRIKRRAKELGMDTTEWQSASSASWLTLTLSSKDLEKKMTLDELAALIGGLKTTLDAQSAELKTLKADVSKVTAAGTNKPAGKDATTDGGTNVSHTRDADDASEPVGNVDPNTNSPSMADLAAKMDEIIKKMSQTTTAPAGDGETPAGHTDDAGNFLMDGSPAQALAKKILIMSGNIEATLPKDPKAAAALLTTTFEALVAKGTIKSVTSSADAGGSDGATKPKSSNAYKTAR